MRTVATRIIRLLSTPPLPTTAIAIKLLMIELLLTLPHLFGFRTHLLRLCVHCHHCHLARECRFVIIRTPVKVRRMQGTTLGGHAAVVVALVGGCNGVLLLLLQGSRSRSRVDHRLYINRHEVLLLVAEVETAVWTCRPFQVVLWWLRCICIPPGSRSRPCSCDPCSSKTHGYRPRDRRS